jgi:hypothetical protein
MTKLMAALLLVVIGEYVTSAQVPMSILEARWSDGVDSAMVTTTVASTCRGRQECLFSVKGLSLPSVSSRLAIRTLSIRFSCGTAVREITAIEYGHVKLSCKELNAPQPLLVLHHTLESGPSRTPSSGERRLMLPAGYSYCWDYLFDLNTSHASASYARLTEGKAEGLLIKWQLTPAGAPQPSVLHHIYLLAGRNASDVSAVCPPRP